MSSYPITLQAMVVTYLASHDLGVLLVNDTYTPALSDATVGDVVAHELSDAGYARQSATPDVVIGSGAVQVEIDPVIVGPFTGAVDVAGVVLYVDTGAGNGCPLLCSDLVDVAIHVPAGQTFTYNPATGGITVLQPVDA